MQNLEIEKLYNEHFELVYKYLFCLTRNKEMSEDLTQETFYRAINKIDTFQGKCKLSVWLCEIAKNLWINEFKKHKRIIPLNEEKEIIDYTFDLENDFILKEEQKKLYEKISTLDNNIRKVFILKLFGNLTFKEIGDVIGKGEVWARVNYYRGKQKIKEGDKNEKRV